MQTPHRPVPSKATLRALRQLTYVASGTACGAAALIYEERRRRIQFLKQVADNGRVLREVSRRSRRSHGSLSAAAALNVRYDGSSHTSEHGYFESADAMRAAYLEGMDLQDSGSLRYRSDVAPSQVERVYRTWQRREEQRTARQETNRSARSVRESSAPGHQTQKTAMIDTASARGIAVKPTGVGPLPLRSVPSGMNSRLAGKTRSTRSELDVQASAAMTRSDWALKHWHTRLAPALTPRSEHDADWQALRQACQSKSSPAAVAFCQQPTSAIAFASLLISLNMHSVLEALCRTLRDSGNLKDIIPEVIRSLDVHEQPSMFVSSLTTIVDFLEKNVLSSRDEHSVQDYLQLILIKDGLMTNNGRRALSTFIADGASDPPEAELQQAVVELVERYAHSGTSNVIRGLGKALSAKSERSKQNSSSTLLWLVEALIKHDERKLAIDIVLDSAASDAVLSPCFNFLWKSVGTDADILDMYNTFGLSSAPDKSTFADIFSALIKQGDSDTVRRELYGRNSRLWENALVSKWTAEKDPINAVNQFWRIQHMVGDRPLNSTLYTVILRLCEENGLNHEYARIVRTQKALTRSTNLYTILDIMKAAENRDWPKVEAGIKLLSMEGFVTTPIQQRVQMMDGIIESYAVVEHSTEDLLQFGSRLFRQICGETSITQTLRLLTLSLVRTGKMDTVEALHQYATEALGRPLELSRVDTADLLRSYYYGFRPSHVGLAVTMTKIFEHAWLASSKHWVPLLVIASAYDRKRGYQRRMVMASHEISRNVLSSIDDKNFSDAILAAPKLSELDLEFVKLDLTAEDDTRSAADEDEQTELDGRAAPAVTTEEVGFVPPAARRYQIVPADSESMLPLASEEAHFASQKSKALLHDARGDDRDAATMQLLAGQKINPLPDNAATLSLGLPDVSSLPADVQAAVQHCLRSSGSEACLSEMRTLITTIKNARDDQAFRKLSHATIRRLKDVITREYIRHERAGQTFNHSLATALGHLMNTIGKPTTCIALIRHALDLPWARLNSPGTTTVLVLLRAYIALGSTSGAQWVTSRILLSNERIERSLLAVYTQGRNKVLAGKIVPQTQHNAPPHPSSPHAAADSTGEKGTNAAEAFAQELSRLRALCLRRREEQVERARVVGARLAAHITRHTPRPKRGLPNDAGLAKILPDRVARKRGLVAADEELDRRWDEARIVQALCSDVVTLAKRVRGGGTVDGKSDKGTRNGSGSGLVSKRNMSLQDLPAGVTRDLKTVGWVRKQHQHRLQHQQSQKHDERAWRVQEVY